MYTVNYFIKKFEAIPEENWMVNRFSYKKNFLSKRTFCAQGFCMPLKLLKLMGSMPKNERLTIEVGCFTEWFDLVKLFEPGREGNFELVVGGINNGINERYQQSTPKQRILAALYDIKGNEAVDTFH